MRFSTASNATVFVVGLATLVLAFFASSAQAAKNCSGSIDVNINVVYTWTVGNETDAAMYPANAHFSGAVCAISTKPALFITGSTASPGFVSIAETGSTSLLVSELENNPDVVKVESTNALAIGTSVGSYSMKFSGNQSVSYIACVSMIAPSPDWVVGLTNFNLCDAETGKYVAKEERLLRAYDAGSDSGATYTAANAKTDPQGKIDVATEGVIANYGFVQLSTATSSATGGTTAGDSASDADSDAATSPEKEDDDDGVCFPASATVELEDGRFVQMSDLAVGDSVKVGVDEFSKVFMFTHKLSDVRHRFVTLDTATGASLTLTKGHYIYADGVLVAAGDVGVGSTVTLGDGRMDTVVAVGSRVEAGLYNPQTVNGNIVVNGVQASTYTMAVEPTLAHALLAPFRAAFRSLGFSSVSLESGSDSLVRLARSVPAVGL